MILYGYMKTSLKNSKNISTTTKRISAPEKNLFIQIKKSRPKVTIRVVMRVMQQKNIRQLWHHKVILGQSLKLRLEILNKMSPLKRHKLTSLILKKVVVVPTSLLMPWMIFSEEDHQTMMDLVTSLETPIKPPLIWVQVSKLAPCSNKR